jgi:hypothetical protein
METMKCSDCNRDGQPSARGDVCAECLQLRLDLIAAVKEQAVCMDEFRQLQQVISRRNGQAANAIRRCLGLTAPEI